MNTEMKKLNIESFSKIKEYNLAENKYADVDIQDLTDECQTIPYITFGGSERKKVAK